MISVKWPILIKRVVNIYTIKQERVHLVVLMLCPCSLLPLCAVRVSIRNIRLLRPSCTPTQTESVGSLILATP